MRFIFLFPFAMLLAAGMCHMMMLFEKVFEALAIRLRGEAS